jgi:nucleotide-binding universal stress UspA family protein
MYESILLPYDGSEGADRALDHAGTMAQWTEATLQLIYVADTTMDSVTVVGHEVVDALEEHGRSVLGEAQDTLDALNIDYKTDVVQGNPAPTIVEYASRYEHDLIVMPTHGRTGLSRYLLGSISEKVVRLSSVPVLTTRLAPDEKLVFPYENVLLPTDGSEGAMAAARHGLELAGNLEASVHVLSIVEDESLGPDVRSRVEHRDGERAAQDVVETVTAEAETYGVTSTVSAVERGSPVEAIVEYVDENDIHAVVMGTTGRRGTERILLGSVAEKTVRSAPVPVITVGREQ